MCRTSTFWVVLLIVSAWSYLSGTSQAQPSQRLPGGGEDPFASVNRSLYGAADDSLRMLLATDSSQPANSDELNATKTVESLFGGTVARSQTLVQSILAREGVPTELSGVVKVESSGNRFALSPKGARGLWQLMPETARKYGLEVDSRRDERIDVEKSTAAAARYLRDLYAQFGSWPLALAAYNTGESNLRRAMNRAQSNQFAVLSFLRVIPAETRNYVPAVLANMNSPFSTMQQWPAESFPANLVYAGSAFLGESSSEGKR